jgi:hypothetical protein
VQLIGAVNAIYKTGNSRTGSTTGNSTLDEKNQAQ